MAFIWKMEEVKGGIRRESDVYFGAVSDIYDYMRDNKEGYDVEHGDYKKIIYKNYFGDLVVFEKKYLYAKDWSR